MDTQNLEQKTNPLMCDFPFCRSERIYKNGLCYDHWRLIGTAEPKKESKPISKQSSKREKLDREYKKVVKEMLAEDDRCEIKSPECTGKAQGLNHIEKRSDRNLLDPENLERACNACNSYVERHPLWAAEKGHSKSKHKIS